MSESSNLDSVDSVTGTERSADLIDNTGGISNADRRVTRSTNKHRPSPTADDDKAGDQPSSSPASASSPARRSDRLQYMINNAVAEDKKKIDAPPAASTRSRKKRETKEAKVWCWCDGKVDDDNMVLCSNLDCKKEWFHWKCVKLEAQPEGTWFCPECAVLPECWTRVRKE